MMKAGERESDASDDHLVALAREGDREAFALLVKRHYGFIHRVAWRLCGDRADAEDLAQDVCVRLGRAIRTFRGEAGLRTWLYALTLNAARDRARRSGRREAGRLAFAAEAGIGCRNREPDDPAEALWEAVRRLPAKQRDAVTLVYGEGLSHAAAAAAMACAEATVSWHVHEAKKRLKQMMASAGDDLA